MQAEQIQRVSVVGAGQMGLGIAQVCAAQGLEVVLSDINREHAERAVERMRAGLDRLVARGKLGRQEQEDTLARIRVEEDSPHDVELVIEAASEDRTLKLELFRRLDRRTQPNALLCSNTSSISISALAGVTQRAAQVAGMHFMNPVPRMKLVEIVRGVQTSPTTLACAVKFAQLLGKTAVVSRDLPGFIVNRVLVPMLNEACFALQEGLASIEDIDSGAELGLNHPMGPLKLADLIGLDTVLAIAEVLQTDLGDDKYRPAALLRNLVSAGWLGRKSSRGFYLYDDQGRITGPNLGVAP
jgi:3-hydroxybutyryl-CoA dehydrogenase